MKTFQIKKYEIPSEKIPEGTQIRLALLADQHGVCFGQENEPLLQAIREEQPDAVLLAGDMICRRDMVSMEETERYLCRLAGEYPVFYGMGNHESFEAANREEWYIEYERRLREAGVSCLHNKMRTIQVKGVELHIYGLELPLTCYRKPFPSHPTLGSITRRIGDPRLEGLNILIAHDPMFAPVYFLWGADLTVCGHYHGGAVRLGEHRGLISPQLQLFPPYCCGDFRQGDQWMIVSPGLGEHSFSPRIHDPRELIFLTLKPKSGDRL